MPKLSAKQWMLILAISVVVFAPPMVWKRYRGSARMIRAVRAGNVTRVEKMLSAHPELLNARDDHHRAGAVQWAVVANQPAILELLIERGADLDAGDRHGMTALHSAAIFNRADMVQRLLARGADPYAMGLGYGAIRLTPLHKAAEAGSLEAVEALLDDGVNVNVLTEGANRVSPLHIAAARGHQGVIRLLADRGAQMNLRDVTGATPLRWAMRMEKDDTITLLRLLGGRE